MDARGSTKTTHNLVLPSASYKHQIIGSLGASLCIPGVKPSRSSAWGVSISWLDTTAIAGVHRIQWRKLIIQISKVFGWTVPFKVFNCLLWSFKCQNNFILSLRLSQYIRKGDEIVLDLNVLFPGSKMERVFLGPLHAWINWFYKQTKVSIIILRHCRSCMNIKKHKFCENICSGTGWSCTDEPSVQISEGFNGPPLQLWCSTSGCFVSRFFLACFSR